VDLARKRRAGSIPAASTFGQRCSRAAHPPGTIRLNHRRLRRVSANSSMFPWSLGLSRRKLGECHFASLGFKVED
jgi:hypothetical protein